MPNLSGKRSKPPIWNLTLNTARTYLTVMLSMLILIQDQEYRDPDTGQLFDRESLNAELEKIENPQVSVIQRFS